MLNVECRVQNAELMCLRRIYMWDVVNAVPYKGLILICVGVGASTTRYISVRSTPKFCILHSKKAEVFYHFSFLYFSLVAIPPRMWRSCLFFSRTAFTCP